MSFEQDDTEKNRSEPPPIAEAPIAIADQSKNRFGRLHITSPFFDVLSHIRSVVIPGTIAIFSAVNGSTWGLLIAGLLFIPSIFMALFRYFTFRFRIHEGELVVTQGLIFRRVRTIPLHRIQNVNLVQNPLHRILNVAEARVETASGTEPEAILRVLSVAHLQTLRSSILQKQPSVTTIDLEESQEIADSQSESEVETEILRIPLQWLFKVGLANNKGAILSGFIGWVYFQFDLGDRFDWSGVGDFFGRINGRFATPMLILAAILAFLILLRLLSIAFYMMRFYDYRLTRVGDDLRITCGLFTKISASIPRGRIQFISIQQNLWMRWMGLSSIRVETAGGSGQESKDAGKSVSGKWFIPVLSDSQVQAVVEQLREGLDWQPDTLDWRPLSPRAEKRSTRIAIMMSLAVSLIGLGITRPWGFLAGIVISIPLVLLAVRASRAMRYARTEQGVIYRNGLFNKKLSMTFFDRIQTVRVDQSPFDRRWKMAELSVDTAAAGPAEHRIRIPYLAEDFAKREYLEILQRASNS